MLMLMLSAIVGWFIRGRRGKNVRELEASAEPTSPGAI